MDPTTCLAELCDALRMGDKEEAAEKCSHLMRWLSNGGFPPQNVMAEEFMTLLKHLKIE